MAIWRFVHLYIHLFGNDVQTALQSVFLFSLSPLCVSQHSLPESWQQVPQICHNSNFLLPLSIQRDAGKMYLWHCFHNAFALTENSHFFFFRIHHIRPIILRFFFFLGLHLRRMEVPRLGVESELQLQVYAIVTGSELHLWPATTAAFGIAGPLTHWARPGIKPSSSQILCWVFNLLSHNGNSLRLVLKPLVKSPNLKYPDCFSNAMYPKGLFFSLSQLKLSFKAWPPSYLSH